MLVMLNDTMGNQTYPIHFVRIYLPQEKNARDYLQQLQNTTARTHKTKAMTYTVIADAESHMDKVYGKAKSCRILYSQQTKSK